MLERELKFFVPPAARQALEAELRQAGAQPLVLRARYFDTPDQALARAGVALRLRLEGEQWVQTVKAPGPDELSRTEINHPRAEPVLDISLYRDTALQSIFADLGQTLLMRYETDITRLVLRHEGGGGAVEFAYDQGCIRSGQATIEVCELELEQMGCSIAHLFELGRHWLERYGLVLDFRSKAERGGHLANIVHQGNPTDRSVPPFPPREPKAMVLRADMTLRQAYLEYANDCLNQIVRNAMPLAAEHTDGQSALGAEYARQMHAGMQRLQSSWSLCLAHTDIDPMGLDARLEALSGATDPQATQALAASVPFQGCLLGILQHLVEQAALA
ncbi:CYTH domain-containing protein [Pusillimonas sp. MFBS29]|uniref:CYTH domain-containing protein n=1 Tax=Pusillimonas sp. MFBS29 TaxID=2886690 RepID=UPI001D119053|nr:CYTH domain-containing protein [Pusillimonas sp. MFBS29]MCC2596940.1 CYTH domain-containing protein [Pusillimonas sp. MFBS29]